MLWLTADWLISPLHWDDAKPNQLGCLMPRMPIARVWSGLHPARLSNAGHADEIRRLREHALALVMVARNAVDPDLSAKLDVIAIEILTSAAKLARDKVARLASDSRCSSSSLR